MLATLPIRTGKQRSKQNWKSMEKKPRLRSILLHSIQRTLFAITTLCRSGGGVPMLQQAGAELSASALSPVPRRRKPLAERFKPVTICTTSGAPYFTRRRSQLQRFACFTEEDTLTSCHYPQMNGRRLLLAHSHPWSHCWATLEVWYPASQDLSRTAPEVLETLSRQLATAIISGAAKLLKNNKRT